MSDPTLRLSGITKAYNHNKPNEVTVLRGIDLEVARGEVARYTGCGAGRDRGH